VKENLEAFILRPDQNFASFFSLVNGATAKLLARGIWVPIDVLAWALHATPLRKTDFCRGEATQAI
jgi:hypothetical protein